MDDDTPTIEVLVKWVDGADWIEAEEIHAPYLLCTEGVYGLVVAGIRHTLVTGYTLVFAQIELDQLPYPNIEDAKIHMNFSFEIPSVFHHRLVELVRQDDDLPKLIETE